MREEKKEEIRQKISREKMENKEITRDSGMGEDRKNSTRK